MSPVSDSNDSLAAAGEPRPPLFSLDSMGTRFELLLPDIPLPRATLVAEQIFEIIRNWHDQLNAFSPSTFVGRFNRSPVHEWQSVDRELWDFLIFCREIWDKSNGLFDPTLGGVMRRLGMREATGGDAAWGMQHIEYDFQRLAVRRLSTVELDFGSVAKGWAIDIAVAELQALGINQALIHGGTSTVAAIGDRPGGGAWLIHAVPDLGGPVVHLKDSAMSVSSPRGRMAETGVASHHVIDPRTGASATCRRWAVCEGVSAAETDAWSTVALVADRSTFDGAAGLKLTLDGALWSGPGVEPIGGPSL